jgi:hypothetical protein
LVVGAASESITGGSGATTVVGGNLDTITGNTGTLLVDFIARASGTATVNLTADHGATILMDISLGAKTTNATDNVSVTGFSITTDIIASKTSVSSSGAFLGTSSASGGNTILTFLDGTTMTLAGVADVGAIRFTL